MHKILEEIDNEIARLKEVKNILTGVGSTAAETKAIHVVPKKHHTMSAAGRKAVSDAAKARWAKVHAETKAKEKQLAEKAEAKAKKKAEKVEAKTVVKAKKQPKEKTEQPVAVAA